MLAKIECIFFHVKKIEIRLKFDCVKLKLDYVKLKFENVKLYFNFVNFMYELNLNFTIVQLISTNVIMNFTYVEIISVVIKKKPCKRYLQN